jgi:hypothetical protein
MRRPLAFLLLMLSPGAARAGLYYSGEPLAELPSRWRGFLLDQRALRLIAARPRPGQPASPLRTRYEQEAARLGKLHKAGKLDADGLADLGALRLRLGDVPGALAVLRPAQRSHPVHFRLAANLGTAWQLHGDFTQAAACLELAARLAPGKLARAEQLHLKLVRLRGREKPGTQSLDHLFRVSYVGPSGKYEPGRLAERQRKALPSAAVGLVQQLALWLPADARLLWQLAELASAHGDVTTAAAIMDGCVTEFGLRHPDLQAHRKLERAAAQALARKGVPDRKEHEAHALPFKPRSSRPLLSKTALAALPAIKPTGLNTLPWEVLAETTLDRKARPTFAKYLKELDGKRVTLTGYMQPLGEDTDLGAFLLIEHPVGCWYCEMPDMVGIVLIELPEGKTGRFTREAIRVTGKLALNATDPENFLYIVRDARVSEAE